MKERSVRFARLLFVFVLFIFVLPRSGIGQTISLEIETNCRGKTTLKAYGEKGDNFIYAQSNRNWGELYAGRIIHCHSALKFGVGMGVETNQRPLRMGVFVHYSKRDYQINLAAEDGGSGFWHKAEIIHKISRDISLGLVSRGGYREGLMVSLGVGKSKAKVVLYPNKQKTISLSMYF
ncbi:MAG: hypothetical protein CEN88_177 [Candidatus Berkelbacteria bacterium Licking1014_2]|uniref:DUF2490 domain-containing protein n=1 Tax=Candidatus Berkelbacteria bacterium Licking1014_2 TaxID=2017146 RepID=A0A554LW60_9BACT|nr:MAG: hypothetical protein CEN88_177 [Candidatus Berkelbacteria bacterium Licking1014_2]